MPSRGAAATALAVIVYASSGTYFATASSLQVDVQGAERVPLLLAVQDGPPGEAALREWSNYLGEFGRERTPVFVLCSECDLSESLPHVQEFFSSGEESWAEILERFFSENMEAQVFGLLGEGAVPNQDLVGVIHSLQQPLAAANATVVLTRTQGRHRDPVNVGNGEKRVWLSDKFISQVWFNRAMLGSSASGFSGWLEDAGLEEVAVQDLTLLRVLPRLVSNPAVRLVDGTSVLRSTFAVGEEGQEMPVAAAADSEDICIGTLEYALVYGGDGKVRIGTAPWPPAYVLEEVSNEDDVVMVNNVNCGYLDFATNFLKSVQAVSDAKVLWVAMDEVAFDFMDALAPGCVAIFPEEGSQRHHAIKAGTFGDATFKAEVLVRPSILLAILEQGHTVFWTDSDVVWLENPLGLLPDINDPRSAEVMLQDDGGSNNLCTCFMYLQSTDTSKELLMRWKQLIIETDAVQDQKPFNVALVQQQDAGLLLDILPPGAFPTGKEFFDHDYVENYTQVYHESTIVVHNNWIRGHEAKRARFRQYHLWDVENVSFPECSG